MNNKLVKVLTENWIFFLLPVALASIPMSLDYLPTNENIYRLQQKRLSAAIEHFDDEQYLKCISLTDQLINESEFQEILQESTLYKAKSIFELVNNGTIPNMKLEIDLPFLLNQYATIYSVDKELQNLFFQTLKLFLKKGYRDKPLELATEGVKNNMLDTNQLEQYILITLMNTDMYEPHSRKSLFEELHNIIAIASELYSEQAQSHLTAAKIALLYKEENYFEVKQTFLSNRETLKTHPEIELYIPVIQKASKLTEGNYLKLEEYPGATTVQRLMDLASDPGKKGAPELKGGHELNNIVSNMLDLIYHGNYDALPEILNDPKVRDIIIYNYILDLEKITSVITLAIKETTDPSLLNSLLNSIDSLMNNVIEHPELMALKAAIYRKLARDNRDMLVKSARIYIKISQLDNVKNEIRRKWFDEGINILKEGQFYLRADKLYEEIGHLFGMKLPDLKWNHTRLMMLEGLYRETIEAANEYVEYQPGTDPLVPELLLEIGKINLLLGNTENAINGMEKINLIQYRISPIQRSILNQQKILYADVLLNKAKAYSEALHNETDGDKRFKLLLKTKSILTEYIERYKHFYNDPRTELHMMSAYRLLVQLHTEEQNLDDALAIITEAENLTLNTIKSERQAYTDLILMKSNIFYIKGGYQKAIDYADMAAKSAKDPLRKLMSEVLSIKASSRLGQVEGALVDEVIKKIEELLKQENVIEEIKSFMKSERDTIRVINETNRN